MHIDPKHIAKAAELAARANHYLLALRSISPEEAGEAKQILIDRENSGEISGPVMDRALYLLAEAAGIRESEL